MRYQGVVRWNGPIKRIREEGMIKGVYRFEAEYVRLKGIPRQGWRDGVKEAVGSTDSSKRMRDKGLYGIE